jgi:hypothetical protein
MHAASSAALSCAHVVTANAAHEERLHLRSCFRLFRRLSVHVVGECPDREQRPEENSHMQLSAEHLVGTSRDVPLAQCA